MIVDNFRMKEGNRSRTPMCKVRQGRRWAGKVAGLSGSYCWLLPHKGLCLAAPAPGISRGCSSPRPRQRIRAELLPLCCES